jgi:serine/threonine protein kinase
MADVSSAMMFLHDKNRNGVPNTEPIIHSNLKSSNILLEIDEKGDLRAKITGFGFAAVKEIIDTKTALVGKGKVTRNVYSPPELQQSRKITVSESKNTLICFSSILIFFKKKVGL